MGRKDHQQLVVVARLIAMQGHHVQLDAAPTVRDDDAVAVSSRNARLGPAGRALARRIPRALGRAVDRVRAARAAGTTVEADALVGAAAGVLAVDGLTLDYLELVDPERIIPLGGLLPADVDALLAVAVHVRTGTGEGAGTVRLIDNVRLGDAEDEQRLGDALTAAPRPGAAQG
jgi:pantoate--beta-alanine ligase